MKTVKMRIYTGKIKVKIKIKITSNIYSVDHYILFIQFNGTINTEYRSSSRSPSFNTAMLRKKESFLTYKESLKWS